MKIASAQPTSPRMVPPEARRQYRPTVFLLEIFMKNSGASPDSLTLQGGNLYDV
jgi:hypothetical protein